MAKTTRTTNFILGSRYASHVQFLSVELQKFLAKKKRLKIGNLKNEIAFGDEIDNDLIEPILPTIYLKTKSK